MQATRVINASADDSAQAVFLPYNTRYAPLLVKVLFLCFNNPKHQP